MNHDVTGDFDPKKQKEKPSDWMAQIKNGILNNHAVGVYGIRSLSAVWNQGVSLVWNQSEGEYTLARDAIRLRQYHAPYG